VPPLPEAPSNMWDTIVSTLAVEFSDLTDVVGMTQVVSRLLLSVVLAAIVGYERERRGSSAGLRTHMMVALGVSLLVVASDQSGMDREGVSRVIQGVFAGIGFLGAGAIIKQDTREQVRGLTTAASLWATAAIASAAGLGREGTAIIATLLAIVILSLLFRLERRQAIASQHQSLIHAGTRETRHDDRDLTSDEPRR
jgi:putative Mg2+ transporter-C (MgtC) family protein